MDRLSRAIYKDTGFQLDSYSDMLSQRQGVSLERIEQKIKTGWPTEFAALEEAREASRGNSRAQSEARSGDSPDAWASKTQAAINKHFKKNKDEFPDERWLTEKAAKTIEETLRAKPESSYVGTSVFFDSSVDRYHMKATFKSKDGKVFEKDLPVAFATEHRAALVRRHID